MCLLPPPFNVRIKGYFWRVFADSNEEHTGNEFPADQMNTDSDSLHLQPLVDAETGTSVAARDGETLWHDIQDGVDPDGPICSPRDAHELENHCPAALDEADSQWEVEKLVRKRKRGRRVEYFVKWLGYPESWNEWVPMRDISTELVTAFEAELLNP